MNPLVHLACFPKITPSRFKQLAVYFSDLSKIGAAEFTDLTKAGWEENIADEYMRWRDANTVEKLYATMEREGVWAVAIDDKNYPALLKQISDPPIALFIRGQLLPAAMPAVAVVGTRRTTAYGRFACEKIVKKLSENGIAVISGLALGLDAFAHEAALRAGGATIAVLGGGVDRLTVGPRANSPLAERIASSNGALISEYPPGFEPNKFSFPARNRIIAGLSQATLVVEAPHGSGALLTAKYALDYNREVMAVPHSIDSVIGEGGNNLLKQGARVVTDADDILETLNLMDLAPKKELIIPEMNEDEKKIYDVLSNEPKHIDLIIDESGLPSSTASSTVTLMELKNLIRNVGGMRYVKG